MKRLTGLGIVVFCCVAIVLVVPQVAPGNTYYVDVKWTGAETGATNQPFHTLSNAVATANAAAGSHTIYVAGGTYADAANGGLEDYSASGGTGGGILITKIINLYGGYAGTNGPGFDWTTRTPRSSIIDLQAAASRAFYPNVSSGTGPRFDGFTFRNANHTSNGGAIAAAGGFGFGGYWVVNCLFTNNVTSGIGGALAMEPTEGDSVVLDSDFVGNQAANGGAMDWQPYHLNRIVSNCTFISNTAAGGD